MHPVNKLFIDWMLNAMSTIDLFSQFEHGYKSKHYAMHTYTQAERTWKDA